MKKKNEGISHITPVGGNVFADLGFPPDEAKKMKQDSDREIDAKIMLKKGLMTEVSNWITENKLTQEDAAVVLGISPKRVSDVVTQELSGFTVDALVSMLIRAGKKVSVSVSSFVPNQTTIEAIREARSGIPRYEQDDGPLSEDQLQQLLERAQKPKGKAQVISTLFPDDS